MCITTPEGTVLAADSRQSYFNVLKMPRIGSDTATKIFPVNNHIAVTVAGPAFLIDPEEKNGNPKSIGFFINNFINKKLAEGDTVKSIAEKLKDYLADIYRPDEEAKKLEAEMKSWLNQAHGKFVSIQKHPENDGILVMDFVDQNGKTAKRIGQIMPISLIVTGYDAFETKKPELNTYIVNIPGKTEHIRKNGDQNQYGATWTGQTDVVQRVVLGRDQRIFNLDFIQTTLSVLGQEKGQQKVVQDLSLLEYNINWGTMTLFDGIDFAKLMIKTTTAIQKFSDGIRLMPGEIPGVGGPIDIALILPTGKEKGFFWHQKKGLEKSSL